jgi:hypothetical protein
MRITQVILVGVLALTLWGGGSAGAKTVRFSGYDWVVRPAGAGGPGPNQWTEDNVWVDARGYLHLKLAPREGQWQCAEVSTKDRLGFGRYQFWLDGRLDQLDPNVVVGLFNYPTREVGPDGTHEIDLEFARWGKAGAPVGNYTVWPAVAGLKQNTHAFPVAFSGEATTHRFVWTSTQITFQSLRGHRDDDQDALADWRFTPAEPARYLAQQPMPMHLNLWCFQGHPPVDGKPVEWIIRAFRFTPQ